MIGTAEDLPYARRPGPMFDSEKCQATEYYVL